MWGTEAPMLITLRFSCSALLLLLLALILHISHFSSYLSSHNSSLLLNISLQFNVLPSLPWSSSRRNKVIAALSKKQAAFSRAALDQASAGSLWRCNKKLLFLRYKQWRKRRSVWHDEERQRFYGGWRKVPRLQLRSTICFVLRPPCSTQTLVLVLLPLWGLRFDYRSSSPGRAPGSSLNKSKYWRPPNRP